VVLVEQYFEFARDLADRVAVMVRGEVALGGPVETLDDEAVRRLLTV
jgi:urea transport system ATP-binding protein